MAFVFGLVAAVFVLMAWEKFSLDVVAMLAFATLVVTKVLTPEDAFSVFGNDAVITVACMFVLSASLEHTGVLGAFGHLLDRWVGRRDWTMLLVMLPIVALSSAFINNTPVVVVFMPIMISLAAARGIKPSKLLIPLSFASIMGGTCTLIGTSTNILVSSTAQGLGQQPLGMFELGKIGLILTVTGITYLLLFGRHLLPNRETLASLLQTTHSKQYLTEAIIVADSPLIGKRLTETPLAAQPRMRVLEVFRAGDSLVGPSREIVLEHGDLLRLSTDLSSVMEISGIPGVEIATKQRLGLELVGSEKAVVVECVIGPGSELIGASIRESGFRRRYGVIVLAVHREGVNLRENFADVKLEYGDTLLVEGPESAIAELRADPDFLLLLDVPHPAKRSRQQVIAVATVAAVVVLATFKVMPIAHLAMLGALAVIVFGCLQAKDAYASVEWNVVFLIFGMLSLGMALENTGGASLLAEALRRGLGGWGPMVVLSAVVLISSTLTNFLPNNAVAVLLTPIVIETAGALHVSPRPFIIAVAIGASACYATPIGYQTNTLVHGAGGYMFRDFMRVGLPLNLIVWVMATFLIPMFWPF